MKIKFLTSLFAIWLASYSLAFAQNNANNNEPLINKKEIATKNKSADKKPANKDLAPGKNIEEVKTFDFERIFREASFYYEAAQKWTTLKCYPKTGFVCSKHECPKININEPTALILNKKEATMAVCRNKICQYHNAIFEQNGVFINVSVNGVNGLAVKVLGDSRFKEIALIGLDAYITNGECEVIN